MTDPAGWTPDRILTLISVITALFVALGNMRKLGHIERSVNGAEGRLLSEVSALSTRVAMLTGKPSDDLRASNARENLEAKQKL